MVLFGNDDLNESMARDFIILFCCHFEPSRVKFQKKGRSYIDCKADRLSRALRRKREKD